MTLATTRALIYAGACAAVLAANAVFKFDRDPGGYPDKWYPQKQSVHFGIALVIDLCDMYAGGADVGRKARAARDAARKALGDEK